MFLQEQIKGIIIIIYYIKMDIDDICITLKKSNNKFDDHVEFFEKNYNKVLIGVPSCLRFRRWPSDVTAALFSCVRA
jgi:hypothetical protein